MDAWSFNAILLAFGGGIFGACLGGLWSFIMCGFLTMLGCLVVLGGGSDFLLLQVGLGPIFGDLRVWATVILGVQIVIYVVLK